MLSIKQNIKYRARVSGATSRKVVASSLTHKPTFICRERINLKKIFY